MYGHITVLCSTLGSTFSLSVSLSLSLSLSLPFSHSPHYHPSPSFYAFIYLFVQSVSLSLLPPLPPQTPSFSLLHFAPLSTHTCIHSHIIPPTSAFTHMSFHAPIPSFTHMPWSSHYNQSQTALTPTIDHHWLLTHHLSRPGPHLLRLSFF